MAPCREKHWLPASKADVARAILRSIPDRAVQLIMSDDFMGADLLVVESEVHRPSFKDLFITFLRITLHLYIYIYYIHMYIIYV